MTEFGFALVCLWLGACLGVAVMALCAMAKDDDWR